MSDKTHKEIVFRARSIETGEWVEGNYHHNIRKGTWHGITVKETNETVKVYRESLQMKNYEDEWDNV